MTALVTPAEAPAHGHPEAYGRLIVRRFLKHRLAVGSATVVLVVALAAVLAPLIAPYPYARIELGQFFLGPSRTHLLGTDELGHDVLTRMLFAARVSLSVGMTASLGAMGIGCTVGLVTGFYGALWDRILMRIVDLLLAIPTIALMFVLARIIGPGLSSIILVLSVLGWMPTARLIRAEVLRLKNLDFVESARGAGASDLRIIMRHLLPNALPPVIVSATILVGLSILSESTISYFGLGIQPPVPSWGNMLINAQQYLWTDASLALYPGLAIFITVLSFNLVGDGLRDALDPKLRI